MPMKMLPHQVTYQNITDDWFAFIWVDTKFLQLPVSWQITHCHGNTFHETP